MIPKSWLNLIVYVAAEWDIKLVRSRNRTCSWHASRWFWLTDGLAMETSIDTDLRHCLQSYLHFDREKGFSRKCTRRSPRPVSVACRYNHIFVELRLDRLASAYYWSIEWPSSVPSIDSDWWSEDNANCLRVVHANKQEKTIDISPRAQRRALLDPPSGEF